MHAHKLLVSSSITLHLISLTELGAQQLSSTGWSFIPAVSCFICPVLRLHHTPLQTGYKVGAGLFRPTGCIWFFSHFLPNKHMTLIFTERNTSTSGISTKISTERLRLRMFWGTEKQLNRKSVCVGGACGIRVLCGVHVTYFIVLNMRALLLPVDTLYRVSLCFRANEWKVS